MSDSLISTRKVSDTGNSVADYIEEVWECVTCEGDGWIFKRDDVTGFTETIDCPDCKGVGRWTRRR